MAAGLRWENAVPLRYKVRFMKNFCAWPAVLVFLFILSGCAPMNCRLVDVVDGGQFVAMSRAMRPVMLKKNMVDSQGDWYSSFFFSPPADAGRLLVDRLSPAFRFPGARTKIPSTFRSMLTRDAKIRITSGKAVMEQGVQSVLLQLVAVTDWNNDGADDWLVLCKAWYTDTPQRFREYYLVVTDRKKPVWEPYVLMVRDHVYSRITVAADASQGELAESNVMEFMQGQSVMTQSPDKRAMQRKMEESSSLRKTSLQQ